MFHYVYEITNLINGKTYIGIHSTDDMDDGYMGSGLALLNAFKEHGRKNFTKRIIYTGDNRDDISTKEAELVTEEFINRRDNYNLITGGGNENYKPSEETRRRMCKAQSGRTLSEDHKRAISLGGIGKVDSEETKRRKADGARGNTNMLGKRHSDETKAKMSKSAKGREMSKETKEKMSKIKKGNTYCLGRKLSKETRKKISEARKGQTVSEETRKKMSEAHKKGSAEADPYHIISFL